VAPPDLGSRCEGGSPGGGRPPARGPCAAAWRGAGGAASGVHGKSGFRPPLVAPCLRGRPALKPAAHLPHREGVARRAIVRVRAPGRAGARSDARRDAQAGVPSAGKASGATCVQRLDGSRDSAIHTKYRISLRSSSMREPRYPLPRVVSVYVRPLLGGALRARAPRTGARRPARREVFLGACRRRGCLPAAGGAAGVSLDDGVRGSCVSGLDNDPSAGSPTETLLRLLLPLNDKVQWTSRDVAGGGPPPSPRSEHFTGPFNR
jgi:hypothetical protein